MRTFFTNPVAYLSLSLVLMLVALPLVSIGTSNGSPALWRAGLITLLVGAVLLPLQRLLFSPAKSDETADAGDDADHRESEHADEDAAPQTRSTPKE